MAKKSRHRSSRRRASPVRRNRFFIPWPAVFFLLLSVGVLLIGWTFRTNANPVDLFVTAKIPAPPVSSPAVIEVPQDGTKVSSVPISVSGSCPSDGTGAYIKLYRNDVFSGVAICNASNRFQLQTDLFVGANKLMAKIFNKTDDPGPDSNTPTVYYEPAVPPSPGQPPVVKPPPGRPPFTLITDYRYIGYRVGQTVKRELTVGGGNPPYAINIDWGDGTNSVVSRRQAGTFTAEHKYSQVGSGDLSSYTIKITGSDGDGRQAYLELITIVNPSEGPFAGTLEPPKKWLWLAWPTYIVLLLMATSFYLGEREEFAELKKRGMLRRRA